MRFFKTAAATIMAVGILAGLFFRFEGLMGRYYSDAERSPDEKNYQRYAIRLSREGIPAYQELMRNYIEDPKEHIEAIPSRVGYYTPIAILLCLTKTESFRPGVVLSIVASLLSLVMIFVYGKVTGVSKYCILMSLTLFAISPIDIAIAARVWQDGYLGLLSIVLMLISLIIVNKQNNYNSFLISLYALVGVLATSSKELFWVIYLLISAATAMMLWTTGRRGASAVFLAVVGASILATVFITLYVSNGYENLSQAIRYQKEAHYANPWVQRHQMGGPWELLTGFFRMSPVLVAGSVGGGAMVVEKWRQSNALRHLALMTGAAGIYFLTLSFQGTLNNLRFMTPILPIMCVLSGFFYINVYHSIKNIYKNKTTCSVLMLFLLILVVYSDLKTYTNFHLKNRQSDLPARLFNRIGFNGF